MLRWLCMGVMLGTSARLVVSNTALEGTASNVTSFVTRPEIKAPRFEVIVHGQTAITPGYWFVAPYTSLVSRNQDPEPSGCSIGPLIYDNTGELVWSGACLTNNENTFDFRAWQSHGKTYLSAILDTQTSTGIEHSRAIILDDSFDVVGKYSLPATLKDTTLNFHEFNPTNDGKTVIHIIQKSFLKDVTQVKHSTGETTGRIVDNGFAEVDLRTNKVLFEWWASDHIMLSDSSRVVSGLTQEPPRGWNWIHLNSVDKNDEGDYLVSARYTDAIYKISGQDGSIIWTLGGRKSSFELEPGFNFSRQHDARFISDNKNDGIETISLLDNGGDDQGTTARTSSGLLVKLDTSGQPMRASVIRRWERPGGSISKQRGNFQVLSNGNVFAAWSDQCHLSEHSANGRLLMEARWTTEQFNTYRAWKFNFSSRPAEPPRLKIIVTSTHQAELKTTFYVSWNGATDVATWKFYGNDGESNRLLGTHDRTGFETSLEYRGCVREAYAEAFDTDGKVLGRSSIEHAHDPDDLCLFQGENWGASRVSHETSIFWISAIAICVFSLWRYLRKRRWRRR